MGNSKLQGELWGARPRYWALFEEACAPLHEAVLDLAGVRIGTDFLDAGCGTGVAVALARGRGARTTGLDAAPSLIAVARDRAPEAAFHIGDLEELPFADRQFDVVTGINSFPYAADCVGALREARRVVRPGGRLAVAIWGDPGRCDLAPYINALGSLLPPAAPNAPGPWALSEEGAIENVMREAGIAPSSRHSFGFAMRFADESEAIRILLAPAPATRAVAYKGEREAVRTIREAITSFRQPDGSYSFENVFRIIVAEI